MEILARSNYNASVRKSLQQMAEDREIIVSTGAARFTRSDKKTIGYVYLRNGLVYAASINTYVPNLMTRLVQAGYLDQNGVKTVERKFGDNLTHPDIAEYILDHHLVPEKTMDSISQDFFLEIFQYLISWENVNADWRDKETTDYLKIDNFELNKIINIVDARQDFIKGVAEQFGVDLINLGVITFKTKTTPDFDDETPMMFHQIVSIANGEWNIQSAADNFGLTHFRVVQAIYELWKADYLELSYETYPINAYLNPEELTEEPTPENEPTEGNIVTNEDLSEGIPVYVEPDEPETVPSTTGSFIAPVLEPEEDDADEDYNGNIPAVPEYQSPLIAKLYSDETVSAATDLPRLAAEPEEAPLYESTLTQDKLTEPAYATAVPTPQPITETQPNNTISVPTFSGLEALLAQLSQELEVRRSTIAQAKQEISRKEQEYAALGQEIANKTAELDKAQDEYDKIVNKVNTIK